MKNYNLKAAPTAISQEQKSQNSPKAKRIVMGVDVHLKSYQAARKIDNSVVGPAVSFRSQTELLLYIEKQRKLAEGVTSVAAMASSSAASGVRTTASTPGT